MEETSYCPFVGLPILTKPEWKNISFGTEYELSISLIGKNILTTKAKGHANFEELAQASKICLKIIDNYFDRNIPYIIIDDLSDVKSSSLEAKMFLVSYYRNLPGQFLGLIYHSMPTLLKLSAILAKKVAIYNFRFEICNTYLEAIKTAIDLLHRRKAISDSIRFKELETSYGTQTTSTSSIFSRESLSSSQNFSEIEYTSEFVEFIKQIDWRNDSFSYESLKYNANSPLLPAYQAIAILKTDLDALLSEKNRMYEELQGSQKKLQETNIALKYLVKSRKKETMNIEDKILTNIQELVFPYIEELFESELNDKQVLMIHAIQNNLNEITSSFSQTLEARHIALTHTEIQVAKLIKQGYKSKEIASLLNISSKTVNAHRNKIRKKLGINKKKVNLIAYLMEIETQA